MDEKNICHRVNIIFYFSKGIVQISVLILEVFLQFNRKHFNCPCNRSRKRSNIIAGVNTALITGMSFSKWMAHPRQWKVDWTRFK